ncbi:EnvZ/OmpR regulon moderator MzrA [Erwinia psidii]|uniref:Modulator protein MzrA n=1 Tax=Erwinia psidii TaxID=69224 RepID=A0A3N6SDV6_9GAMM|nr:EnvZ/OmpR regulon moderator MzrA [Erwinia psidii]MCX8958196.1 EnvZ/OmpR regulon moderator MzrA [Erwinia psidii]MCX8963125.1 EnvZ/OmpR regulon moderator MzrA [Erwinia psidii]MCX8966933.1 EnvZ/OmpR regulon moderator MzrA [Erwinia psidii]RQM38073.1 EnvZ/OmpR regulon moderator MzrA [Erwinia psidii]
MHKRIERIRRQTLPRYIALFTVGVVLLIALFLPVFMRNESALHIRASHQGLALPDGFFVYQRLNDEGIPIKSITLDNNALIIKFDTSKQSEAAEKVLRDLLPFDFDIAQQEEHTASDWMPHYQIFG